MAQYVLIAKPVEGSKNKFEDHQILEFVDDKSIEQQIQEGFVKTLGPTGLDDCVAKLKENNTDKSGWFGLTVAQYAMIFIVTGIFVYVIYLGATGLLELLKQKDATGKIVQSHDESARNLITFLVAVGTIAIAFLAILTAMVIREYKERFAAAKEVLVLLIGILGTIVGFYFGAAKNTNVNPNSGLANNSGVVSNTNATPNSNANTNVNLNPNR